MMETKPTYEELEQKVRELQAEAIKGSRADEECRKSKNEWESIFEAFGHPVFLLDRHHRVITTNKATVEITGISREDLAGKKCYEIFHKTSKPPAGCPFEKMKASHQLEVQEMEVALLNGTYLVSCTPMFDPEGRLAKAIHIATDVTDRNDFEKALKESERMLNETQSLSKIGGWEYHVAEKKTLWTDQVYHIHGVTKDAYDLSNLEKDISFYVAEDRIKIDKSFRAALEEGKPYDLELRFISAKGKHLWVRTIGEPILKNGKVIKVMGTLMDITEQKRAKEMLLAERLKLERYFENIPLSAYNISFDGKIVDCNTVAVKTLGWDSKDQLVGNPVISTLYTKESQKKAKQIFEKWKTGKQIKNEELSIVTRTGDIIHVLLNADTVFDSQGTPIYSISTHLDITDRKRAQEEQQKLQTKLRQAEKMAAIATLTGGIAHDYNNLLSVIIGYLSLAMEKADRKSDIADFLNEANRASLKARDLTHELMALSKGSDPVKISGSLRNLVRHSVDYIGPESGIPFTTSFSKDLWKVPHDPFKIGVVLKNVITNAVEAMPHGGGLTIRTENLRVRNEKSAFGVPTMPGNYLHIAVQDQGSGIAPENLKKIFDPYFSTKDRGVKKGMGLGLTTAYAIVEKHEGHIAVDSVLGVGTTVDIYLPAEGGAVETDGIIAAKGGSGLPVKRVLVMDDEEMIRTLAGQMLQRLGCAVETVRDGIEAIEVCKKKHDAGEPFDAVILDLTIKGGMGGKQTVGELLKVDPHMIPIVTSGYFDDPIMSDFAKYGFAGAMAKPYGKVNLKETLEKAGLTFPSKE